MTNEGYCKICAFFDHSTWLRERFQKKVAEGNSLRILKAYLEGLGCRADLKTISSHVSHMDFQIINQRKHEISLRKKTVDSLQKLKHFFKPQILSFPSKSCEHLKTSQFFDVGSEEVMVRCDNCGKILASCDPEKQRKKMERAERNVTLLAACQKTRNRRN